MGDFCEKSHYLKVENTFSTNLKKRAWLSQGGGQGVTNMEKNVFAFLDELER